MKFNKNLLKEKWFSYTIALCSAVVLYLLLTHLSGILQFLKSIWNVGAPVFMAFVIAYVLGPLVEVFSKYVLYKIEQEKLRHTLSVILAILSVVLSIVILAVALIPQVIDSVVLFAGNLNGYVLSFQRLMRQLNSMALQHDLDLSQFISSSDELLQSITRILPENLNKIVNFSYSFGAKMFDWIISFILAIYLMMDRSRLKSGLGRLLHAILPAQAYRSTATFWSRCNRILLQFIAFDVLDGIIIGLCNWVFMVIMGMPYVAIISVVVGVTNLAPTFGPMVGAIIGAFILVLVKPWYALVFLLFTAVLQTLDGYVIKPRLFGEQLGVSSVWILISLIVGGRLLGVAGILLAIPFAAIGDFIYHDYIIKRLEEQNAEHEKLKEAAHEGAKAATSFAAETAVDLTAAAAAGVRTIVPTDGEPEDNPDRTDITDIIPEKAAETTETSGNDSKEVSGDSEISENISEDLSVVSETSEDLEASDTSENIPREDSKASDASAAQESSENDPKEISEVSEGSETSEASGEVSEAAAKETKAPSKKVSKIVSKESLFSILDEFD